jgi:hypothetical protein
LQQFSTELGIAKDNVKTPDEEKVLQLYAEALEIWKDSASLWDAQISMPALRRDAERYCDTYAAFDSSLISLDRSYSRLLILEKLPIQTFPRKSENAVAVLAKHYQLPVKEEEGWKWVRADSFKKLWYLAGEKVAAADNLAKGR